MRTRLSSLVCVCALTLACAEDLPSVSLVEGLRVLAVRAEPPGAPVGSQITVDALVVDSEERAFDYLWSLCSLDGSAAPDSCYGTSLYPLGSDTEASLMMPESSKVVVSLVVALESVGAARCFNELAVGRPPLEGCIASVKTLSAEEHTNPSLQFEGSNEPIDREAEVVLFVDVSSIADDPFVSWFSTAGELRYARTDSESTQNEWTAPDEAGAVDFYAVVHDDRGGVAWAEMSLEVE